MEYLFGLDIETASIKDVLITVDGELMYTVK